MKVIDSIVSKVIIEKGWSDDKKYCISTTDDKKYLLRISSPARYDRKKSEFELISRVASLGVPMCQPVEFGITEEGVYSIHSWIDGVDLESAANMLNESEQYSYGVLAGEILKKIHTISAPDNSEKWENYFNRKIDRKISAYNACPIKYDNGDLFIDYVNSHRHLLVGRPLSYQHGDYHVGNMMLGRDKQLYIIDFDRNDFGDPWEEFNRIVWSAQSMPLFAKGMVNGYFDGKVPAEFWELLALYICSNTLSSLPWAIPFGEQEINVMRNQANDILSWYDNMNTTIPSWYR